MLHVDPISCKRTFPQKYHVNPQNSRTRTINTHNADKYTSRDQSTDKDVTSKHECIPGMAWRPASHHGKVDKQQGTRCEHKQSGGIQLMRGRSAQKRRFKSFDKKQHKHDGGGGGQGGGVVGRWGCRTVRRMEKGYYEAWAASTHDYSCGPIIADESRAMKIAYSASAPAMISISSWVIFAWRARFISRSRLPWSSLALSVADCMALIRDASSEATDSCSVRSSWPFK